MRPLRTFTVVPALPAPLERLRDVAYNVRWAWDHDAIELFRRLDTDLWETSGHNPVRMLALIDQERLVAAAADDSFLAHLDRVAADFADSGRMSWFRRVHGAAEGLSVAYFSAEFGISECVSIFAGGLGVLAGDHLKSSSDLGIPLVGVGLLYQQGYFRQYLTQAGWQQEAYEDNDFLTLPLQLVRRDGAPLAIEVEYPGRRVRAHVWRLTAGRVSLYLLDTNIPGNSAEDRDVTDQLYGGDIEMRLKQEILLGIGGYRALDALGIAPTVCHMNEGHSAFLALERVRLLMERRKLSFAEARELAGAGLVFTEHTPVPAGHDYFPPELMDRYFSPLYNSLGLTRTEFLSLGRVNPADDREAFCPSVLALRVAAFSNGVSKLHGRVARSMWQRIWPGVPVEEVPIGSVTNGVHFRSWISYEMNQLYDRYLGPQWREEGNGHLWRRAESIPAEELWRTHERRRERLVAFARRRLRAQLERRGAPQAEIESADEVLDPEALTIGFARRFAAYKRATLVLRDPDRLLRILSDPERPVQIIFSGKAHPRDEAGKQLIRDVVSLARRKEFRRHIVFLEDHDMAISRYLVQGSDVWLNTPLRPLEASGTSGMKAAANGGLNVSTLDGWWDEAWRESGSNLIGWAIGRGEQYEDRNYQDQVEAEALYDLLENDVVPTFYDRGATRLPRRWIARMKASLSLLCPNFNTHRMVQQYTEEAYLTSHQRYAALGAADAARARAVAAWLARVSSAWSQVRIEAVEDGNAPEMKTGDSLTVRARVRLGTLAPGDVAVDVCHGRVDARGDLVNPTVTPAAFSTRLGDGASMFEAAIRLERGGGQYGFTVRVLPSHPDLTSLRPGLIAWADTSAARAAMP